MPAPVFQPSFPTESRWRQLLDSCPDASVYLTPEFQRCLEQAGIPVHGFHVLRGERVAALALVIEDRLLPLPVYGAKGFCPADVLALDEEAERLLLQGVAARLRRRMLYLELFRPQAELENWRAQLGYQQSAHRNFHIDLRQGHERLWRGYSRSMRRNIQRAGELGLTVRQLRGESELPRLHALLASTSRRVGAPLLPWALLKAVARELLPLHMLRIYVVEAPRPDGSGSEIINTRIELIHKGYAIDWYTGDDPDYRDLQAGPWLVDHILRDLCAQGCHTFDFGGAGREDQYYGPAEFKRRFGGEEIRVVRSLVVWHPWMHRLARGGYRLLSRLQGRGASTPAEPDPKVD